jgi:hypothetical protein
LTSNRKLTPYGTLPSPFRTRRIKESQEF